MAQHDYNITNQTAPTFRADLNLLLDAIVSNNSGTTAPSTTFANMFWYDTTAGVMKQRNEANSAWVTLELTPTILVSLTQTQAEDATSTVFGQVSGQRLSQAIAEQAIGVGQTLVNRTASRLNNVAYQNTSGRTIVIYHALTANGGSSVQVSPNNVTWFTAGSTSGGSLGSSTTILPNNWYARSNAITSWVEMS